MYAADAATTVESGGRSVPLELEPTAALAYQLEGAPGLGHRDRRVPLRLQAAVSRRAGHDASLPAGTRARRARPRHRLEPGPVGGHHQRAPERSEAPRAHPVLALHLQHEQPHPALRQRPAAESPAHPHGARSRGARSGARPARGDRPQPGRAADAPHGHRQRHPLLGRRHRRALRQDRREPRDARADPALDVLRAPAVREAGDLHRHAPPGQLPRLLAGARRGAEARHASPARW